MADASATATAPKAGKAKEQKKATHVPVKLSTGKMSTGPTVEITCSEKGCTVKRVIKKQDKFQVKFCLEHQKKHRNELRRKRRKEKSKIKGKATKATNDKAA